MSGPAWLGEVISAVDDGSGLGLDEPALEPRSADELRTWTLWASTSERADALEHSLRELIRDIAPEVTLAIVRDECVQTSADWGWARDLAPIEVIPGVWSVPTEWSQPLEGTVRMAFRLDPKQAFGTGRHATTQQMTALLWEELRPGERVLDVGTGTGWLAMVAVARGAAHVVATDVDPHAIECARENIVANGMSAIITLRVEDITREHAVEPGVTLILANIIYDALQPLVGVWQRYPGARIITAGVDAEHRLAFEALYGEHFLLVRAIDDGEWFAHVWQVP